MDIGNIPQKERKSKMDATKTLIAALGEAMESRDWYKKLYESAVESASEEREKTQKAVDALKRELAATREEYAGFVAAQERKGAENGLS